MRSPFPDAEMLKKHAKKEIVDTLIQHLVLRSMYILPGALTFLHCSKLTKCCLLCVCLDAVPIEVELCREKGTMTTGPEVQRR